MFCLVFEKMHSKDASKASTQQGDSKKGCFQNPKGASYEAPFIDSHESKP